MLRFAWLACALGLGGCFYDDDDLAPAWDQASYESDPLGADPLDDEPWLKREEATGVLDVSERERIRERNENQQGGLEPAVDIGGHEADRVRQEYEIPEGGGQPGVIDGSRKSGHDCEGKGEADALPDDLET